MTASFDTHPKSLEWDQILAKLAEFCHCEPAKQQCLSLSPSYSKNDIVERWDLVLSLKELAILGYRAAVGEIVPVESILQSAEIGRILEPNELLVIRRLLDSLQQVYPFVRDFMKRSAALAMIAPNLDPLPKLRKELLNCITPDGKIADNASKLLAELRREKIDLSRKIEHKLSSLSKEAPWSTYVQDDFYTVRLERYVLPLRLDGRGRVNGSVIDVSSSGQTLFVEPTVIAAMNQQLADIELSERLEMLRILKELSRLVVEQRAPLENNFVHLVLLDVLSAEAQWALHFNCGKAQLVDKPVLNLVRARHPLIGGGGKGAVANSIALKPEQRALILSGPNAGGKTVVLKTVGIVHLLAKSRLLLPVAEESEIYLFKRVFVEIGDQQNILANLSTFSGHIEGIKPILEQCSAGDLVLLDELASGTEPRTGEAIARSVTEYVAKQGAIVVITSHFDGLKALPAQDPKFRVASLEYDLENRSPTYRLVLDVPGQSYGIELAMQLGLPKEVTNRAYELKGSKTTGLDETIAALSAMKKELESQRSELAKQLDAGALERARWEQEKNLVAATRRDLNEKIASKYKMEFNQFKERLLAEVEELKKSAMQEEGAKQHFFWAQAKSGIEKAASEFGNLHREAPMQNKSELQFSKLKVGQRVHVIPLKKAGVIKKLGANEGEPIEVECEKMKVKVKLRDLSLL